MSTSLPHTSGPGCEALSLRDMDSYSSCTDPGASISLLHTFQLLVPFPSMSQGDHVVNPDTMVQERLLINLYTDANWEMLGMDMFTLCASFNPLTQISTRT